MQELCMKKNLVILFIVAAALMGVVLRVRSELNGFEIQGIEYEFHSIQFNSRIFNSIQLNFESIRTKYSRTRLLENYISDVVNIFRILDVIEVHTTLSGYDEISGIMNENIVPKRFRNKRILL